MPDREGLVVSSIRTPVLRAGYSNVLLFILAVALALCNHDGLGQRSSMSGGAESDHVTP